MQGKRKEKEKLPWLTYLCHSVQDAGVSLFLFSLKKKERERGEG